MTTAGCLATDTPVSFESQPAALCEGTYEGTLVLRTREDVLAASRWEVVHGDLWIGDPRGDGLGSYETDGALRVKPGELSCLRQVTGDVRLGTLVELGEVTLDGLERIDGSLATIYVTDSEHEPAAVRMPALHTVGSPQRPGGLGVQLVESQLGGGVSLPALQVVYGLVSIGALDTPSVDLGALGWVAGPLLLGPLEAAEDVELGQLQEVHGRVTFQNMPRASLSSLLGAVEAMDAPSAVFVRGIGCLRHDGDASPDCEPGH